MMRAGWQPFAVVLVAADLLVAGAGFYPAVDPALLGFVQQSAAALCGVVVGALLGSSAWPLAGAVAVTGTHKGAYYISRTILLQWAPHPTRNR